MRKQLVVLVLLVTILAGWYVFSSRDQLVPISPEKGATDYKNASYVLMERTFTLKDGRAEVSVSENSATKEVVEIFGNEARGDLNDDGLEDIAFILRHLGGGSGVFYYAVAALQAPGGGYRGTNGLLLGDRIAPQTTEIRNGILVVNYADRAPTEPFSTPPSIGVSLYGYFDGNRLVAVPPVGPITIEGTIVCLPHQDTDGPQTLECAFGLHDDDGRYFALLDTDPQYRTVSSVGMNTRVTVEGIFKLRLQSKYQDIGIIEVTKITPSP